MTPDSNDTAHPQFADEETLFVCPDRDGLGFVPSSR
jgi:hypothetical protein